MLASQNEKRKEMLSNDGIPLKKKLSRALFQSRLRAFGLVTPLLLLISVGFVFPIIVLCIIHSIHPFEQLNLNDCPFHEFHHCLKQ